MSYSKAKLITSFFDESGDLTTLYWDPELKEVSLTNRGTGGIAYLELEDIIKLIHGLETIKSYLENND